ncbi:MAG TPA: HNH endonuclease signature motif containing protein [Candidatus Eisenbacteria bacterium]|nr:HNH endonuclease signature motif containing protein [Candidatus Eisenbacteria bacterium]
MKRPSPAVEAFVKQRAHARCEYCQLPEGCSELPFQIDHVVARKHGGATGAENLAYACLYCNSYKGPNLAGVDPLTGEVVRVVRLFNPRTDKWADHFDWRGAWLNGISPPGRATVHVLRMNEPEAVLVRENLIHEGKF